ENGRALDRSSRADDRSDDLSALKSRRSWPIAHRGGRVSFGSRSRLESGPAIRSDDIIERGCQHQLDRPDASAGAQPMWPGQLFAPKQQQGSEGNDCQVGKADSPQMRRLPTRGPQWAAQEQEQGDRAEQQDGVAGGGKSDPRQGLANHRRPAGAKMDPCSPEAITT